MSPKMLFFLSHFIFLFLRIMSAPAFAPYGAAAVMERSFQLTVPQSSSIGRIFYKDQIRIFDSYLNSTLLKSFDTFFSFKITESPPPCISGEGIAFLITSDEDLLPKSGGSMGLPTSDQHDQSFIAVEFDTKLDDNLGDENNNHIGLNFNSAVSEVQKDLMIFGVDLHQGKKIFVWIEYRQEGCVLLIWVGNTQIRPDSAILVIHTDLSKRFGGGGGGDVKVGFSAAGGGGTVIESWYFRTLPTPITQFQVLNSSTCVICFPTNTEAKVKVWGILQKVRGILYRAAAAFKIACEEEFEAMCEDLYRWTKKAISLYMRFLLAFFVIKPTVTLLAMFAGIFAGAGVRPVVPAVLMSVYVKS